MTGKCQPYPSYRATDVKWLGDIPSKWKICAIKHVSTLNPAKSKLQYQQGDECSFVPMEKLKTDSLILDEIRLIADVYDGYTCFVDDDILIAKVTPCFENKNIAIAKDMVNGVGFGSSEIYVLRSNQKANNRYLFYRLQEDGFMEVATASMTGAGGLKRVPSDVLNNFLLALPAYEEQETIAIFLDHETAKIDTLIDKQQQLIKLLKEKRQAVISHAVTKGLNPDVPMKDSGVEWLGEVPEGWEVVKLSYHLSLKSGDGITSQEIEEAGEYPVFGGNGLRGYSNKYNCYGTYALIGRQGALCGNINIAKGKFFASEHAVVVYPQKPFDTNYLADFLRFMDFGQYSISAAQPGISVERINMLKIAIPPLSEQEEIGRHIVVTDRRIQQLVEKAEMGVKLLQERRTALISAAVTGKIDVRNWKSGG